MSTPNIVTLPEPCRASLAGLHQRLKAAEREYNLAAGHALSALGLDPSAANRINLDTGVVTSSDTAPPKE
jgi:hypothetical protein